MKNKKKLIIAAAVIVILGVIIIANVKKGGGVNVEAAKVERGEIEEIVSAPGEICAKEERKINAEVTAEVIKLLVEEGDWVHKGSGRFLAHALRFPGQDLHGQRPRGWLQQYAWRGF